MLQGEIKRDLQHNYLVFPKEQEKHDFEIQMLINHNIQGLLPCMVRKVDGKQLFSYEISGKISMTQQFAARAMEFTDLESMLKSLAEIVEQIKDCLLPVDMLVLEPEYIFLDEVSGQWSFVCFPMEEENVYHSIHKLSQYILTVLNHKEEKAVQMGYALYRSTRNETFSLGQILDQTKEWEEKAVKGRAAEERDRAAEGRDRATEGKDWIAEERDHAAEGKDWIAGGWDWTAEGRGRSAEGKDWIAEGEKEGTHRIEEVREMPFMEAGQVQLEETRFHAESGKRQTEKIRGKKKGFLQSKTRQLFGKEKEKETSEAGWPLLSYAAEAGFAYGNPMCMLKGVTRAREQLRISAFPFLIGSLECAVDGCIDSRNVSHFHARMEKEGDEYYIMDLNSKEGTFVNGQKLPKELSKKIIPGDHVVFGDMEYVFVSR